MTESEFKKLSTESAKRTKTDWDGIAAIVGKHAGQVVPLDQLVTLLGDKLTCKVGQLRNALRHKVNAGKVLADMVEIRYHGSDMFIRVK